MRKRFVWPSIAVRAVPGGLSEEGKSARITQTRELLQSSIRPLHCLGGSEGEARFGCFVRPWAASHEARFVCFVSSHTKQSHAPSVPEWAQGVSERRSRFSRLHHAHTAGIAARVAGHEARLVSFVSGHTKQSRVPGRACMRQITIQYELSPHNSCHPCSILKRSRTASNQESNQRLSQRLAVRNVPSP